jgi:predicted DNA-binding transcriptional regulator
VRERTPKRTTDAPGPEGPTAAYPPTVDKSPTGSSAPAKTAWTFLTNHAHVLLCVAKQPGMRMREVARSVGVTERCVQRILTELEGAGYVTRVHQGRRNHYEVHAELPLRHPAERHQQVSSLLKLVLGGPGSDRDEEA